MPPLKLKELISKLLLRESYQDFNAGNYSGIQLRKSNTLGVE